VIIVISRRVNSTNACPLSLVLKVTVSLVNYLWFSLPRRQTYICDSFWVIKWGFDSHKYMFGVASKTAFVTAKWPYSSNTVLLCLKNGVVNKTVFKESSTSIEDLTASNICFNHTG